VVDWTDAAGRAAFGLRLNQPPKDVLGFIACAFAICLS
jgi:hypothetical protein